MAAEPDILNEFKVFCRARIAHYQDERTKIVEKLTPESLVVTSDRVDLSKIGASIRSLNRIIKVFQEAPNELRAIYDEQVIVERMRGEVWKRTQLEKKNLEGQKLNKERLFGILDWEVLKIGLPSDSCCLPEDKLIQLIALNRAFKSFKAEQGLPQNFKFPSLAYGFLDSILEDTKYPHLQFLFSQQNIRSSKIGKLERGIVRKQRKKDVPKVYCCGIFQQQEEELSALIDMQIKLIDFFRSFRLTPQIEPLSKQPHPPVCPLDRRGRGFKRVH